MSKRRPYVRPMDGWWKKNPYFVEYMVHEGTALFVAAYAFTLLVGLVRLGQGEAAWNGWLEALKSPLSLAFHAVLLVAILYHTYTWFKIMPRTLPPIIVGGKKLAPATITGGGLMAALVASLVLLGLVWRIAQ
ncbi:MAG: fumarate reductase subunit C [Sterolibacteriaceae bacterium]|uniref:Fumarate reductase subunit C n=1 Tax=Candidatus Methylophosphatis roskildensis TaxID=2899263 RepID=A0A9D7E3A6_9PROT|nr:fumarate reductase subunit C [Candidatus Methylophosphatis roskildensis]MBK7236778.1 fumarate reductase subunit C [Sterolibacteriaceae bacterium]MBK7664882.1 fumarate reductase subunit C [Sterolibacteriaceae bacterium]MBK9085146.1 fumarate reductase subunit C [Sterolibacteriaceae bacterium]